MLGRVLLTMLQRVAGAQAGCEKDASTKGLKHSYESSDLCPVWQFLVEIHNNEKEKKKKRKEKVKFDRERERGTKTTWWKIIKL